MTLEEMLAKKAKLIAEARKLADAAGTEKRNLNTEECSSTEKFLD